MWHGCTNCRIYHITHQPVCALAPVFELICERGLHKGLLLQAARTHAETSAAEREAAVLGRQRRAEAVLQAAAAAERHQQAQRRAAQAAVEAARRAAQLRKAEEEAQRTAQLEVGRR